MQVGAGASPRHRFELGILPRRRGFRVRAGTYLRYAGVWLEGVGAVLRARVPCPAFGASCSFNATAFGGRNGSETLARSLAFNRVSSPAGRAGATNGRHAPPMAVDAV